MLDLEEVSQTRKPGSEQNTNMSQLVTISGALFTVDCLEVQQREGGEGRWRPGKCQRGRFKLVVINKTQAIASSEIIIHNLD